MDRSAAVALCTSGRKLKQPPVAGVPVTIAAVRENLVSIFVVSRGTFLVPRVCKESNQWGDDLLKQMKNSSMVAWLFPTSQPP